MIANGQIEPIIYSGNYVGLSSVPEALEDIAARKVWGKAVIHIDETGLERQMVRL
jgi:NADPH:quinone reductase